MEIDVHQLKVARDSGEKFLLLDVRQEEEVQVASIDGATHIPMNEIPQRLAELDGWRDGRVVVLCHAGVRSARVQEFLMAQGFKNVENVSGGIHAWSTEIDPSVPVY